MKVLNTLIFLLAIIQISFSQNTSMSIFDNLVGKTWQAEGKWGDGSKFKQEITLEYSLDKNLVVTKSKGFTDQEQTKYGDRNHGIRKYDEASKSLKFWEFDVFGGVTEGTISSEGKNIMYQYEYGGSKVTDLWEYVDDHTYNFKVGNYADGKWKQVYLNTQFKALPQESLTASQTDLPYKKIPDYPEKYTATNVAARMVDGLGFRYYWATEGLREQDLSFKPSPEGRTLEQTVDHIHGLVLTIVNAVNERPNIRSASPPPKLSFAEKRKATLLNLQEASNILKKSKSKKMKDFMVIFQNGENKTEFPFWNEINGPIADALWHVGQVVSFRRSAGNPFPSGVSVLSGVRRE